MGQLTETLGVSEEAQTRLRKQFAEQTILLRVSQQLASSFDLPETMPYVAQSVLDAVGAEVARVVLRDSATSASYGAGKLTGDPVALDRHLLDLAQTSGQITIEDLSKVTGDPRFASLAEYYDALALWPLQVGNRLLGLLWLGYSTAHEFSDNELTFLSTLAEMTATAIANAQSYQDAVDDLQSLEVVLGSTVDPILVVDWEQKVALLNPAAEALLSLKAGRVLNELVSDALENYPNLLRLFDENYEIAEDEEWAGPDGRTYSPRLSKVVFKSGKFGGWVLILQDITHFKLLHRNQEQFVRLVSHDLRSPLTFMQGFASLLTMTGELNDRQTGFVEKILNGITQMTLLVDNIQDAGRWDLQTGFYEMSREPCDLTSMVYDIVSNHRDVAEKQRITISASVAPNVPIVSVDSIMVERALINLVSNAIKYSPNGGDVTVSVEVKDDHVLICVVDTGLGIAEEHLSALFQRGNRIVTPETKKHKIKGSGLGLFIVHSVAQWHDGDAWVESKLNAGSRFYFSIPLSGANLVGGSNI